MRWPWKRKQQQDSGEKVLTWMARHPGRNYVHDHLWPECNQPLPHSHPALTLDGRSGGEDPPA